MIRSNMFFFRQGNLNLDRLGDKTPAVRAYGEANDDGVDEFLEPVPHHIHLHVHEICGTSAESRFSWSKRRQET